ncbi:AAA family ATPase [Vibrio splendidus]|uniref:Uncharacterized protein n=1 Tax=Vibrio splendidus TaxID=29497 RepID=A0A2T5DW70_VIBSP|nr:AAA family ATPase [Vibrio splendidus]OEE70697.1 hypothetical protein A147_14505 [Vibrio splendidus FF-6]PTP11320.1 hypothetical protein CWO36_25320 [Vibrio splendidus]
MHNKINSISITGFRAFSEEKKLDFRTESGTADIVVIYAPNGTGKTSTIEGLEWAATGKISRIDDILKKSGSRNGNPKEGHILKNRNYGGRTGSVSIQLDGGETIRRNTKPKENRNNDYNDGRLIDSVENMASFEHNILSQGSISKFSYEASNGNLFDTLIKNKSKENSEDITLYDKINSVKTSVEGEISARKTEIEYINSIITDNENSLSDLKIQAISDESLIESNDYIFFKNNFSIYEDLSSKSIDESISYFYGVNSSINSIKSKLLAFDIDSYKSAFKSYLHSKKILELSEKISKLKIESDSLKGKASTIEVNKNKLSIFLNKDNMGSFSRDISYYRNAIKTIEVLQSGVVKKQRAIENLSYGYLRQDSSALTDKLLTIELVRQQYELLFLNCDDLKDKNLVENELLESVNKEIRNKKQQLKALDFDTFLKMDENISLYSKLTSQKKSLDELNIKISSLLKEKETLISFEEKLSLIKSYVLEVVDEKELKDCPACGTSYENKDTLISSIKSLESNAQSLVEGAISILNTQKENLIDEISILNKDAKSSMSKLFSEIDEKIPLLEQRNSRITEFFSMMRSLGIDVENGIHTPVFIERLNNLEASTRKSIILYSKRKAKYERWENDLKILVEDEIKKLNEISIKVKMLKGSYLSSHDEDIERLVIDSDYMHVKLYRYHEYTSQLNIINSELVTINIGVENLLSELTKIKIKLGKLTDDSYETIMTESDLFIKYLRSEFNFINDNINGFRISNISHMIDFISRLEDLITSFISGAKSLQKVERKSKEIAENKVELLRLGKELSKEKLKLKKLESALTETMGYFSTLASNSINNDILNDMFMYVEPHLKYDKISFKVDIHKKSKGIYIQAGSSSTNERNTPIYYLSEAQINILSICIFLAEHARDLDTPINTIVIDDPVQSMDDLNSYALIDLCKVFARRFKKQIIITTHNISFFDLFRNKLPEDRYPTKYIKL